MNAWQTIRFTLLTASLVGVLWSTVACAEESLPWEIAPYRTQVWVEIDPDCHIDSTFAQRLNERLTQQAYAANGSILETQCISSPVRLVRWLDGNADSHAFFARLETLDDQAKQIDRVHLVSLRQIGSRWQIAFREFDCLTRSWGSKHESSVSQIQLVPAAILRLMSAKFAPLAKVIDVEKSDVALSLRATTLVQEEVLSRTERYNHSLEFAWPTDNTNFKNAIPLSPSSVPLPEDIVGGLYPGQAMQPVLRRNDRQGNLVSADGILFMPWTYINCESNNGLVVRGKMLSGYSQPMPGRRNVRTQRLAIGIHPIANSTQLTLIDKASKKTPLAGYEIYAKDASGSKLLGASDANGHVRIPADPKNAVRLLYVRSGGNLLARLPLVPGLEPEMEARITNDGPRLLAEGFVEGWRDQLVDTMAHRLLLAQRIERKIEQGDLETAEKWLAELRSGRTVNELAFELRNAKGQFLKDPKLDPTIKRRIDDLFEKGQRLVTQDKSLQVEGKLAQDLEAAKRNKR